MGTGYADGYPWSLGNRGIAAVGGHRVPVVGRVSMDLITLDVTGVPEDLVQPGSLIQHHYRLRLDPGVSATAMRAARSSVVPKSRVPKRFSRAS